MRYDAPLLGKDATCSRSIERFGDFAKAIEARSVGRGCPLPSPGT